jgi:signal transduction histidine kinase
VSTGLLLALPLLFWNGYPRSILPPALLYLTSAFLLGIAGSGNPGLGVLFFLPVVGVALFGSRLESGITIAGVVAATVLADPFDPIGAAAMVRRAGLYAGLACVITIAIVTLREQLVRSRERAELLLKDAQAVNDMATRLATLLEPAAIKRTAAELAATVGSPPGSAWRRGAFLGLNDGQVTVEAQFDQLEDQETAIDLGWPFPDDRLIDEAIRTGTVASGPTTVKAAGSERPPTDLDEAQVAHATWVPLTVNGQRSGLLGVASRRGPMPETSIDQLVSLAHLVELALSNWLAHEELEEGATREDRRRIARELHDGLAQELAFIASKATPATLTNNTSAVTQQLADAAVRALDEARRAIVVLSESPEAPSVSISQTAEDLCARHGMTARLDVADDVVLNGDRTENLLRIIREAITNAARHGQASTVSLRFGQYGSAIQLLIVDDGGGFDLQDRSATSGFGLTFMDERCASMGGSLQVSSRPGTGTRIEVRLPA